MIRIFTLLLALPIVALGDDASEQKRLDGTWIGTEAELGGKKMAPKVVESIRLKITDGKYLVEVGKERDEGTLKLNSNGKPKSMDIVGVTGPNKGKTFLAIYELTDDSLRICYDLSGEGRPKEFSTDDKTQRFLVVYRREKK
jgi:uncharacterized protein (TIGR03067 family)